MVSGYVLILAVLLLGGVIATLGDRIGMRVGKARLSLFNLRPKQTATVVSIATGSVISASTLALLFGISSQLRTGVFELSEIQGDLESAREELIKAESAQTEVESQLEASRSQQQQAQAQLEEINQSLQSAYEQQQQTRSQLQSTRQQLVTVSQQASNLNQEIQQLQSERQELLRQQATIDEQIRRRDQDIAERDQQIALKEQQLAGLESQQQFLEAEVAALQEQYDDLFRGNIALRRNQELVSGLVRVGNPEQANQFVEQLLLEANRIALRQITPGTPVGQFIIETESRELNQLVNQISDGKEYLVRVLSAANYVVGEPCVLENQSQPCIQVITYAVENELIYPAGTVLSTATLTAEELSDQELVERINFLIAAAQFRARQDGVIGDALQVADNRTETLLRFLEAIKAYGRPLTIRAVTVAPIYTVGPVRTELIAQRGERVVFTTSSPNQPPNTDLELPSPWPN
ncbi:DUF3084 domain-containing protein [filamentous cyanobacterium CCP5]|nr:DUF3084 domain-containing protein [filamentous cyanobacterium CCP5]